MKKILNTLLAFGMLAIASTASAVPIVGSVAFGTNPGASWVPTGGTVATATGVAFIGTTPANDDEGVVTGATGTFAGSEGTIADFMDFVFNPLTAGTQLWQFDYAGNTFKLFMNASTIVAQTSSIISLTGTGMLTGTSYTNTFGRWDLTLNATGAAFSFSSGAAPEPGVVLLLGAGLVGIGVVRKFRKGA